MKFDLHCHTKEGSIDSKIGIVEYAHILKRSGFAGMMVTDHDSYKGYSYWKEFVAPYQESECSLRDHTLSLDFVRYHWAKDFVVLKGIEYDTKDAGHFLVIMPDGVDLKVLQIRGMPVKSLIKLVHKFGGILGPAHPYGVKSSSFMFFKTITRNPEILTEMDFLEGFNTCESKESNELAVKLGEAYNLPMVGGSDSHASKYVGKGYTIFFDEIKCNNDLILAIKQNRIKGFGGKERKETLKGRLKMSPPAIVAFKTYNRGLGALFTPYRNRMARKLMVNDNKAVTSQA